MADKLDIAESLRSRTVYTSTGGDQPLSKVTQFLSTGSLKADVAIGGGYPVGRIIEVFGPNGAGKTASAFHAAADCQKKGGIVFWSDNENAWDPIKAKRIGVDVDKVIVLYPLTLEDFYQMAYSVVCTTKNVEGILNDDDRSKLEEDTEKMVKRLQSLDLSDIESINLAKELNSSISINRQILVIDDFRVRCKDNISLPILFVWDSMKATRTRSAISFIETGEGKFSGGMMETPRVIGEGTSLLTIPIGIYQVCFLVLNQITQGPGSGMYGSPDYETTGGNTWKHAPSLRIDLSWKGRGEDGQITKWWIVKNKLERPKVYFESYQSFYTGFDPMYDIYEEAINGELIKEGRKYANDASDEDIWWDKGYEGFVKFMSDNSEYFETLKAKVLSNFRDHIQLADFSMFEEVIDESIK